LKAALGRLKAAQKRILDGKITFGGCAGKHSPRICAGMDQMMPNLQKNRDEMELSQPIPPRFNDSPCLAGGLPRELTAPVA